MSHTVVDDFDRFGFTRHELLSSSTATAAAPLALVSAPQAAFEVTTLDDVVDATDGVLSLREAITLANDTPGRDTITFAPDLFGGRISLATDLPTITDDLTIDGDVLNRGPSSIILDGAFDYSAADGGSGARNVLYISDAELSVSDVTITGSGYDAIGASNSKLLLERIAVDGNFYVGGPYGVGGGAGIDIVNSSLSINDSIITNVRGIRAGSLGLGFRDSDVSISNSSISNNDLAGIRGINGNLLISNSTIDSNNGPYLSYGIALRSVNLLLQNSTLANNGNNAYAGNAD